MSEIPNPNQETQPPLFAPDGSPSVELKEALKKIEEDINTKKKMADEEWIRKHNEEIEENREERWKNHAP